MDGVKHPPSRSRSPTRSSSIISSIVARRSFWQHALIFEGCIEEIARGAFLILYVALHKKCADLGHFQKAL